MTKPVSISEAAAGFRQGSLRPVDLLQQCLERIDRYEGRVRAWVVVDEPGARRAAEEAQRRLAAGRGLGPLDGIPLGIKDIIDVEGFPTRAGSPLCENHLARADAPLVGALRRAVQQGDTGHGSLMAGQSVGLVTRVQPVAEIIRALVEDTEAELQRVKRTLL